MLSLKLGRLLALAATLAVCGCAELTSTSAIPSGPLRDGQCARGRSFLQNEMSAERRLAITDGLRAQGCGLG